VNNAALEIVALITSGPGATGATIPFVNTTNDFEKTFPATNTRVEESTPRSAMTRSAPPPNVRCGVYAGANKGEIGARLRELDREWDMRTMREINRERIALRILRGDFQATSEPTEALNQAREE